MLYIWNHFGSLPSNAAVLLNLDNLQPAQSCAGNFGDPWAAHDTPSKSGEKTGSASPYGEWPISNPSRG